MPLLIDPFAGAHQGFGRAGGADAVDIHFRRPDHEVDVYHAVVAALRYHLLLRQRIAVSQTSLVALAQGNVAGDKFYTAIGENGFVKPFTGFIQEEEYFFVKTFNFFQNNPANFDLPATSSLVLLFDAETGYPACLMEAGWVTGLKTAAVV